MTKITEILDRASRQCSVVITDVVWPTNSTLTVKEIRDDFMLETIDELQKRIDWSSPIGKQVEIVGDDSENYALPVDFVRLTNDQLAVYETSTTRRAGVPIDSDGAWAHLKSLGSGGGARYYRVKGYEGAYTIDFFPALVANDSVTISYVSNVWMKNSGGTEGSAFTDVDDVSMYPRRIIELGIVWRFRKRKGLPYGDVNAEYEAWLATTANRMRGRGVINFGGTVRGAYPFDIPVPDFIPPA